MSLLLQKVLLFMRYMPLYYGTLLLLEEYFMLLHSDHSTGQLTTGNH